jgi:hypothetical protein
VRGGKQKANVSNEISGSCREIPSGYRRIDQRRAATIAQIASTRPNGQAPCRNP